MHTAQQIRAPFTSSDPQAWLAGVLRSRLNEVLKHGTAVLDPSAFEAVHDMRVAVRRLRSVIRDFAEISDKFPLRHLRRTLKRLADTLGQVRDADVFINAIEKLSKRAPDPEVLRGISGIITERREKRESARAQLEKLLTDGFFDELQSRFDTALDESIRQRDLFQVADVSEAGGRIISSCLDQFLERSDGIYYPLNTRRLHRLRIAGKHLRYSIELFEEVFGGELTAFAEQAREMQSHLGDVHDCDVWMADVRSHLVSSKHPQHARPKVNDADLAAAWLLSQFIRLRTRACRSALELWTTWETGNFQDELRTSISQ